MKQNTEKFIIGTIIVIFAIAFFIKEQYWQAFFSLGILIVLANIERLKKFVLGKDGLESEFYKIPEENIKQDIRDNKEQINKKTLVDFRKIEEEVLEHISSKIKGSMRFLLLLIKSIRSSVSAFTSFASGGK